jgi:hypothetical protein
MCVPVRCYKQQQQLNVFLRKGNLKSNRESHDVCTIHKLQLLHTVWNYTIYNYTMYE